MKLQKDLKEKEKKHAAITKKNEEYLKQVTELKIQLTIKENDLYTLQQKYTRDNIEEIKSIVNQEKDKQEEELEEVRSKIESLKKQNSELEQKIAEKTKSVEVQTQELDKLREKTRAQMMELEANLRAKQKVINKYEGKKKIEIGAIEEKVKEKISKLENELEHEKAAKSREQLESRVKWLEEEKKLIAEANELKRKIETLGRELALWHIALPIAITVTVFLCVALILCIVMILHIY